MGKFQFFTCSVAAALTLALAAPHSAAYAAEPEKELSEKSVRVITGFALTTIPSEFRQPDGTVVKIDKSDVSKIIVPLEDARHIIKAAWLSAKAQECEMKDEQTQNYLRLMRSEQAKKKWSKEQILFINRLHLFTVMWLTGNVKFTEGGAENDKPMSDAEIAAATKGKERVCTAEEKDQIKSRIDNFWKSAQN